VEAKEEATPANRERIFNRRLGTFAGYGDRRIA